jgi:hypothetical protein
MSHAVTHGVHSSAYDDRYVEDKVGHEATGWVGWVSAAYRYLAVAHGRAY